MKLITISGLDGSGKSTQIEMLKVYLESQGKKVFYFHAIRFGLAQKISEFKKKYCLICRLAGRCKNDGGGKSVTKANAFQIFLRRIFLMIDLKRFQALKKKLSGEGYDYLLSDRYFFDTVVNIDYLRNSEKALPCEKFIIAPDRAVFLDAEPELIMRRERQPDQGLDYLQKKQALFRGKVPAWKLHRVDGNRDPQEVFAEIKNYV